MYWIRNWYVQLAFCIQAVLALNSLFYYTKHREDIYGLFLRIQGRAPSTVTEFIWNRTLITCLYFPDTVARVFRWNTLPAKWCNDLMWNNQTWRASKAWKDSSGKTKGILYAYGKHFTIFQFAMKIGWWTQFVT